MKAIIAEIERLGPDAVAFRWGSIAEYAERVWLLGAATAQRVEDHFMRE